MKQTSEHDSFSRFLAGDHTIFVELYNQHKAFIYNYCYSFLRSEEEANDVTADAFFELWKNREDIGDAAHIKAYLITVARNKSIDVLRHKATRKEFVHRAAEGMPAQYEGSDQHLIRQEMIHTVLKEIERLPTQRMRDIFLLRFYAEKSVEEIAQIKGITVKVVYNNCVRARAALRATFLKKALSTVSVLLIILLSRH